MSFGKIACHRLPCRVMDGDASRDTIKSGITREESRYRRNKPSSWAA